MSTTRLQWEVVKHALEHIPTALPVSLTDARQRYEHAHDSFNGRGAKRIADDCAEVVMVMSNKGAREALRAVENMDANYATRLKAAITDFAERYPSTQELDRRRAALEGWTLAEVTGPAVQTVDDVVVAVLADDANIW